MPRLLPHLPGAWGKWAARSWAPLLFLLVAGLLWRWLPPRPLVTIRYPDGPPRPFFSPDGKFLMAQNVQEKGLTGPLRVWELPGGREVTGPLADYQLSGWAAALPDGELLLETHGEAGSGRSPFRLVELATGRERLCLDGTRDSTYRLSADGKRLAWAPEGLLSPVVEVWDLSTCRREARLEHGRLIALSPDGDTLVCNPGPPFTDRSRVETLIVWDVTSGRERGRITETVGPYSSSWARFCPDGRTLVVEGAGPQGGLLKLWDLDAGRERAALLRPYRFAFIRGGCVLAASGSEPKFTSRVRCWDVATGRELDSIPLRVSAGKFMFASLLASPDGRTLAVETASSIPGWQFTVPLSPPRVLWSREQKSFRELKLLDATTGRELATLPASYMERYYFSADGSLLAVAQVDGRIDVWQVPPRKPVWTAVGLAGLLVGFVLLLVRWPRRRRRVAEASAGPTDHPGAG